MIAEAGVVKLINGPRTWTGVMLESSGLIATTTSNLGESPTIQYVTPGGVAGQAWVAGRDDDFNLALYHAVNPPGAFDVIEVGDISVPNVGKELVTLQHLGAGSRPTANNTSVAGSRQSLANGLLYFQLQGRYDPGTEGGAVVDEYGQLRGIRMEQSFMVDIGLSLPEESYALSAGNLIDIIPRVQGAIRIDPEVNQCVGGGTSIPPIPTFFSGNITVGGSLPPSGSKVYAKVTHRTLNDLWFFSDVSSSGRYRLTIGACQQAYENQRIEFWLDGAAATETGTFRSAQSFSLDLSFPSTN